MLIIPVLPMTVIAVHYEKIARICWPAGKKAKKNLDKIV